MAAFTDATNVISLANTYTDVAGNTGTIDQRQLHDRHGAADRHQRDCERHAAHQRRRGPPGRFVVTVTFSEAMNTGVAPTLTFGAAVGTTLSFASGAWNGAGTQYSATYNVADVNVNVPNVTIDVTGGVDPAGNARLDHTPQVEFSITRRTWRR